MKFEIEICGYMHLQNKLAFIAGPAKGTTSSRVKPALFGIVIHGRDAFFCRVFLRNEILTLLHDSYMQNNETRRKPYMCVIIMNHTSYVLFSKDFVECIRVW